MMAMAMTSLDDGLSVPRCAPQPAMRSVAGSERILVAAGALLALFMCGALSGCALRAIPDAAHGFSRRTLDGRAYQVYRPRDFTPTKKWPVIIYLHGGGERGDDGVSSAEVGLGPAVFRTNGSLPFVVAFPQAEQPWPFANEEARVLAIVDAMIRDEAGDPDRVYLTGNSMGGFGTWIIGARHPERFAALVPICGGVRAPRTVNVPPDSFSRQPDPEAAAARALGSMPVWAFHGGRDRIASPESSRRLVAALRAVGGDVTYTEYPDLGHDAWDRAYADPGLYTWLLAHRRGERPAPGGTRPE